MLNTGTTYGRCILKSLGYSGDTAPVFASFDQTAGVTNLSQPTGASAFDLLHSQQCPLRIQTVDNPEKRTVSAACIVLLSADQTVLLTRRPGNIIFPNAWVAPGGRHDPGELIEETRVLCEYRKAKSNCLLFDTSAINE